MTEARGSRRGLVQFNGVIPLKETLSIASTDSTVALVTAVKHIFEINVDPAGKHPEARASELCDVACGRSLCVLPDREPAPAPARLRHHPVRQDRAREPLEGVHRYHQRQVLYSIIPSSIINLYSFYSSRPSSEISNSREQIT